MYCDSVADDNAVVSTFDKVSEAATGTVAAFARDVVVTDRSALEGSAWSGCAAASRIIFEKFALAAGPLGVKYAIIS
jgi:hypothetical protein